MEKYYGAVRNRNRNDELTHWKYVYKEKKNGKWRYYKDDMDKDDNQSEFYVKTKGNPRDKYGTYEHGSGTGRSPEYIIKVKRGKSLLTKERTIKDPNSGNSTKYREIGKIEQGYDAAKKKVKKIGQKAVKSLNKQIDRGQKWLDDRFD